jgi:hypothetical protein
MKRHNRVIYRGDPWQEYADDIDSFVSRADVAGPAVAQTTGNRPKSGQGMIPFRRATTRRNTISVQTNGVTLSTVGQNIQVTVEGTGYMTGIRLIATGTTAGNSADVAYREDAPFSLFSSIVLSDTSGEEINVTGYDLFIANLYGGWTGYGTNPTGSSDTNIYQAVTGTGATGGSFRFPLLVPCAINARNFLGLLGNQDRALKYQLRDDVSTLTAVYSTAPTNAPTIVIDRYYESVTVPGQTNTQGIPQEIYPPKFGVQHFLTRSVSPSAPQGGSTVNHFLARLGNTIRWMALIFRSNGLRSSAETYMPTRITFLIADTTIFTEDTKDRRVIMRERYGFDAPNGVLVYDFISDILMEAANEFGMDYLWTAGLVNAQFQIDYPSGFGSTNNSLVILTDDLIVPDEVDIYAPDGV